MPVIEESAQSWICPKCRRHVPRTSSRCQCGYGNQIATTETRWGAIAAGVFVFFAGVSGLLVFLIAENTSTKVAGGGVAALCGFFMLWKTFQALTGDSSRKELADFADRDSGLGTSWRSLFGNRSWGFWVGCAGSFVLLVSWSEGSKIDIRQMSLPIILVGGFAGDWLAARVLRVKGSVTGSTAPARSLRRRLMLAFGVLLFVVNVLPRTGLNGELYWTSGSSLFAGIGAVLAVLVIVTKPKDESF